MRSSLEISYRVGKCQKKQVVISIHSKAAAYIAYCKQLIMEETLPGEKVFVKHRTYKRPVEGRFPYGY